MSANQIIWTIGAVFLMVVIAPIVFFYIRPNYERFQMREPWMYVFLYLFSGVGVFAISAKTERTWRTVFNIIASLDLIGGLLLLYIAIYLY